MKRILPLVLVLAAASTIFAAPKPKVTSATTASGTVGVAFSYQITADQAITTWGASGLPAGLTVNTSTGLISGTPTTAGTYSVTISATNSSGTGTATLTLTIAPPPTAGNPWIYTSPSGTTAASTIMTLDQVAAAGREPDFFELLQAAISNGSLGQSTAVPNTTPPTYGVTGVKVFPDIHMSSTMLHILTIGACIIDQADPDSIPTRIRFTGTNQLTGTNATWTAYGVENLPYITQLYPIAGASPDNPTKWATYLLFQLWNPHQIPSPSPTPPPVRLRVDGGIGIFTGGNGENWNPSSTEFINATGQSATLNTAASFSTAAPLTTGNATPAPTSPPAFTPGFYLLYAPAVPTPTP